ncbi:Kinesin-like protein KIF26A [Liparis tanakae]|uniref:Kinesin-like protein KIF26A n=1 Tax=Liparis tanakae TaxID=230148 RepID=A0A4Z2J335_9TELE|nr:Kinesin-like protein KIF26A [Liparis tanakae]
MLQVEGCPSGESPATPRKRLHSAEDARCSSRPPPEGAGSVSISESEEKGGFCQQCQKKVTELKKQALALADENALKPVAQKSRSTAGKMKQEPTEAAQQMPTYTHAIHAHRHIKRQLMLGL